MKQDMKITVRYKKQVALTHEEENALFAQYELGDIAARDILVERNTGFVAKIAREYTKNGVPFEDLFQEGLIGLLDSVEKFDRTMGFRFTTFAAFGIRQAIITALRKQSSLVRIPQRKCKVMGRLTQVIQDYTARYGHKPQLSEVAQILDEPVSVLESLMTVCEGIVSLQQAAYEFETNWEEKLCNHSASTALDAYDDECKRELVDTLLKTLPAKEEKLLRVRFGLTESPDQESSLRAAGKAIGVSQEGARRIEHRVIAKLNKVAYRKSLLELVS